MFTLYGETFPSRLLLGTAAYPTPEILKQSVQIAQPAMITVSLRRAGSGGEAHGQGFLVVVGRNGRACVTQYRRLSKCAGSCDHCANGTRSV